MVIDIEKEYLSCGKKVEIFVRVTSRFFNRENQSKYGYVLKQIFKLKDRTVFLYSLQLSTIYRNFVHIVLRSTIICDQNEALIPWKNASLILEFGIFAYYY